MANYDRYEQNDFGRRSDNRYDRYATERYSGDRPNDRERMNNERWTGDWRDDERRSRDEDDRGFFERAANTVTSWFSGDDDDNPRRNWRDEERERRYSTEGRGSRTDWNSTFDTRHGANMDRDRFYDRSELRDEWRTDNNTTASRRDNENISQRQDNSSRYGRSNRSQYPERFDHDQPDGREAGRDYYNRLNDEMRSGANYNTQRSPYASNQSPSGRSGSSNNGSYGRTGGSNFATYSTDYGYSGDNTRRTSGWSNQSGTYGDNSGTYGSASRGQYSGKGPKGYRRSDDRIKEDVCEYLTRNAMIDASDVDISVVEGVVTLTGTVPDRQMKRMTEDEIESLPGVKDVNNQLRVSRQTDTSGSSMSMSAAPTTNTNSASTNGSSTNGSSRSENNSSNSSTNSTSSNTSRKSSGVS